MSNPSNHKKQIKEAITLLKKEGRLSFAALVKTLEGISGDEIYEVWEEEGLTPSRNGAVCVMEG